MYSSNSRTDWFWFTLTVATVLLITTISMPQNADAIPYQDKIGHVLYLGLISTVVARRGNMWLAMATGILISVGIELMQYFIPWRSCDVVDAICGIGGSVVAVAMYQVKWYRDILEFRIVRLHKRK